LPDFTDLVEEVSPAVVNISTSRAATSSPMAGGPGMPDLEGMPPIFREFFEHGFPQSPQQQQQPRQQQQAPILQLPGCKRARTMLEVEEACCRLQGGSFRVHECPSEEGQMLSQQPEGHHHNHSTLPQQHIGCTPLLHLDPGGIQLASSNAAACSQFSMPASACEQIQQRIGTLLILDLVSSH
jgi:hypothetical protein